MTVQRSAPAAVESGRDTDEVAVPNRPFVPGLRFRRYRPDDVPGMTEANQASRLALGTLSTVSLGDMQNYYANLTGVDLERDILIVEIGGRIGGYARIELTDQTDGSLSYDQTCLLRPEHRRVGIGRAMLGWSHRRIGELARARVADLRTVWIGSWTYDADRGAAVLLEASGYAAVRRSYEMLRRTLDDIPDVEMPYDLEVRPLTIADARQVFAAEAEAFRDHWGDHDESEPAFQRFVGSPYTDPGLWVIAFDGDEIAGMVLNSIDEDANRKQDVQHGWLDSVSVRRPWRRRGLARALCARSLRLLRDRGMTAAVLDVDVQNPNGALALYEGLGFEVVTSATAWRMPIEELRAEER